MTGIAGDRLRALEVVRVDGFHHRYHLARSFLQRSVCGTIGRMAVIAGDSERTFKKLHRRNQLVRCGPLQHLDVLESGFGPSTGEPSGVLGERGGCRKSHSQYAECCNKQRLGGYPVHIRLLFLVPKTSVRLPQSQEPLLSNTEPLVCKTDSASEPHSATGGANCKGIQYGLLCRQFTLFNSGTYGGIMRGFSRRQFVTIGLGVAALRATSVSTRTLSQQRAAPDDV